MAKSYVYELWRYGYIQVEGKWVCRWTLFGVYDSNRDAKAMLDKLDEDENGSHPLERETVSTFKIVKKRCAKKTNK